MFRNQYDTDVTVWSPEGRLLQVEYAMESVKQGSAVVGLRSSKSTVLGALKRSVNELSSHQKKLMVIDSHMAIGIAGLTADARSIAKWMRSECLNHKYVYGTQMPTSKVVKDLADKHQRTTQTYVRRPYGVGLLVASVDRGVPALFQTCPSGNIYEFYATAIGARSQGGKTYLEKHYESFGTEDDDNLIMHALRALGACVSGDQELTEENGSIALVTSNGMQVLEGANLRPYLERLEAEGGGSTTEGDATNETKDEAEPMEE
mmetsp:Transcript_25237/g.58303  ORF Transcript_25237/g.58303 Transcript_25237/m.58303 type:complete len:262 (-) Transcript_25237:216-1001(-)|eukprot:CAMPEP_0113296918 /NCGR_PEP_ID=MMETSP0010_2-20120614/2_1 /TAXON_ID=216773 ORGANISM="Corethron hystrix, Strain 308" /NCGR_SAMPLE_ID=MMETSP0010_2 /ASSEMBLY_ACC=CAM_ASM_000155 /LENGTH=261 /DNA_ID=CAMNT_0000149731 /DNA_START=224 /DNA_END=1009 /DNA_ORIENTATION=- /assembly_acc=CAM_ASM_000155